MTPEVANFGQAGDGAQGMVHITRLPEPVVRWLQDQVHCPGGGDPRPGRGLPGRCAAGVVLAADQYRMGRLFSGSGMPVRANYKGNQYPIVIRLRTSNARLSEQGIDEMPDGPPVTVQRWAFGIGEHGNTSSSTDLRTLRYQYAYTWKVDKGALREIVLTPNLAWTLNQTTTTSTTGVSAQAFSIHRSREKSWLYSYDMSVDFHLTNGIGDITRSLHTLATSLDGRRRPGCRPIR